MFALSLSLCPSVPLSAQVPTGDAAWSQGDFHAARIAYEHALRDDSSSVRALYRLAILASWDSKLDSALVLLRKARALEPTELDVRAYEAKVLSWNGDTRGAIARYDSILAVAPDNREAAYGRGQTLAWSGRYDEADKAYVELVERNPADLDAIAARAQVAAWRGDLARAVDIYQSALKTDPNHVRSLVGLAQVRNWQGRHRESMQLADRALALEKNDREAQQVVASVRAARRPELNGSIGWSHDSDKNTNWWETIGTALYLADGLRAFASAGLGELHDPARDAHRYVAEVGATYATGNLGITAAVGLRTLTADSGSDRTPASWRSAVSYRPSPRWGAGVGYAHYPFDETAFLVSRKLNVDELSLDGDVDVGWMTSLGAGGGLAWLSDDNTRHSVVLSATKRLTGNWNAGVFGRLMGYDHKGIGYFSPDRFLVGEVRSTYTWRSSKWEARAGAGLGLQQVASDARAQGEWHLDGRLARRWATINEIALSGSYTNSAASSTSGAFRYYTGILSLRLGL